MWKAQREAHEPGVLGHGVNAIPPSTASLPLLMDSVIQAVAELEQKVPVTEANHTVSVWHLSGWVSDP
ncbi:N-acetylmuramoyl-L-alanine amidase [Myotis davidii]|uniref:N-acetylmuramoyl-L-alanine amidase n=1 Tax=Myotis davidii TaxID=225400 RepID=L5M7I1_MYODS|nr:N-acetylmuramoyl-L-alanine amidase [Myotis davidii]